MTAAYDYESQDPHFLRDLRHSRHAVDVVARWLSSQGYPTIVRPTFERPHPGVMAEYSDSGDLEILHRVEVKRRPSMDFSGADNFPYRSVIVDACHCYDRARPKPYAYVILNSSMSSGIVVECRTFPHWVRVTKTDRAKGRDREFYECPIDLCRFVQIPVEMRSHQE